MESKHVEGLRHDPQLVTHRTPNGRPTWVAGLVVSMALAGSLAGCTTPTASQPVSAASGSSASAPVAGATLSAAEFAVALKRPNTVLLDVRTPAEFATGHLSGATNIDVEASDFGTRIAALDTSKAYALYCRSGNRSKVAMNAMQKAGFGQVFHLGGGITAWAAGGGTLTTN